MVPRGIGIAVLGHHESLKMLGKGLNGLFRRVMGSGTNMGSIASDGNSKSSILTSLLRLAVKPRQAGFQEAQAGQSLGGLHQRVQGHHLHELRRGLQEFPDPQIRREGRQGPQIRCDGAGAVPQGRVERRKLSTGHLAHGDAGLGESLAVCAAVGIIRSQSTKDRSARSATFKYWRASCFWLWANPAPPAPKGNFASTWLSRRDAGQGRESQRQIELPGLHLPHQIKGAAKTRLQLDGAAHLHVCRPAGPLERGIQAEPQVGFQAREILKALQIKLMKRTLRGGIKALARGVSEAFARPRSSSCSPAVTESSRALTCSLTTLRATRLLGAPPTSPSPR